MSIFHIFKIRREECGLVLLVLLFFVGLQSLLISQHTHAYFLGAHGGFWTIFRKAFEVSGYDCWSWITVSGLRIHFDTMRHPLFFSLLYPLYWLDRKSTRLNSSHANISYAVFCLKKKKIMLPLYHRII